jgi:long-chain fatty acid transport protein
MAYGVKLGADFKVADGISLGAVVQPKMSSDELDFFKTFLTGMGFNGDAELVLPNVAGVGAKFGAGKSVDIVADVLWYQWSGVDVFEFFGWEDQIVLKVGAEFRPTDKLALRAGYNYGKSPIEGGNRTGNGGGDVAFANYPFPAISEHHFTIGLGYKMDKSMAVNAYYLHSPEACQTATTSSAGMTGGPTAIGTEICMTQNAFGVGVNYQAK